jgi:hypothetical protein
MTDELEWIWKEVAVVNRGIVPKFIWNELGKLQKKKTATQISDVSAEKRTEYPPPK